MNKEYYCHECHKWLDESEVYLEDSTDSWETFKGRVTATIKLTKCKYCGCEIFNEEEERKNDLKVLGRSGKRDLVDQKLTKFLTFKKYKQENKKTFDIEVIGRHGEFLGEIKWENGWRRYAFVTPRYEIILDEQCLDTVKEYISNLMKERSRYPSG